MEAFNHFISDLPFTRATWFTLGTLIFFVWLFARASKDPNNLIKWEHLIVDSSNNRASPYKLGYIIGLIVGTWIVVRWADTGSLTYDIFGMYLSYLLGGAGVNSFAKSKETPRDRYPYRRDEPRRDYERDDDLPRPSVAPKTADDVEDPLPRP